MVGRWRTTLEDAFRNSMLDQAGWVRTAPVLKQIAHFAQKGSAPLQLWYLFVLESWLKYECQYEEDEANRAGLVCH